MPERSYIKRLKRSTPLAESFCSADPQLSDLFSPEHLSHLYSPGDLSVVLPAAPTIAVVTGHETASAVLTGSAFGWAPMQDDKPAGENVGAAVAAEETDFISVIAEPQDLAARGAAQRLRRARCECRCHEEPGNSP
jgi:hypothetical protein